MYPLRGFLVLLACLWTQAAISDPRVIIHLTDYLANDYPGAVGPDGRVLSSTEYAEQLEFGKKVLNEGLSDSKLTADATLMMDLKNLEKYISQKKPPSEVVPLARKVQQSTIKVSGIQLSPMKWPNYKRAKELFQSNCISCHGAEGRGDGVDGKDLDPRPANFHDTERASGISPFASFNTIRLGVPGTGMAAWDLSDEDVWSLAFYVSTFRFGDPEKNRVKKFKIPDDELLIKAASLNDPQLKEYLNGEGLTSPETVKKVRLYSPSTKLSGALSETIGLLEDAINELSEGHHAEAKKLALDAYFIGFEPLEKTLSANDPELVNSIEQKMSDFRQAVEEKNASQLTVAHAELTKLLEAAKPYLHGSEMTPGIAFTSGFSIILREGFEAVLIIVAILGVGKVAGSSLVLLSIHLGWIFSLFLGTIGWILSGWLLSISGYSRELVEGFTSLLAVTILVYVGFWMHRQTEIQRWKEFINVKVKNLVHAKNLLGLFMLSFIVSFREVLETVLFLRTIYSESSIDGHKAMVAGVLLAFILVLGVAMLLMKFRQKVPLQKFFTLSAVLMLFLSVVLAGKGLHSLQEAGLVGVKMIKGFPRVELLGIFPSVQVLVTQLVVGIMCTYIWLRGKKRA